MPKIYKRYIKKNNGIQSIDETHHSWLAYYYDTIRYIVKTIGRAAVSPEIRMKQKPKQTADNYSSQNPPKGKLPPNLKVERGETQRNVNHIILHNLANMISVDQPFKALDLPCGQLLFLGYLKEIFPLVEPIGADIITPKQKEGINFVKMDLTKEFTLPRAEEFDIITSISGVMMFSNTLSFIENCSSRLKKEGTIVITNDNSMTMMDRLRYALLGRVRMFNPIFEDHETVVQNIPIMELIRLLRINRIQIEKIEYTSIYFRDMIYLPLALLIYPLQYLYLLRLKNGLAKKMRWQVYPFKHLLCRHYIIFGKKMG